MKKRFAVITISTLLLFVLSALSAQAIPTVNLHLMDSDIQVGDSFDVEVWVDGDDIGLDLLTFSFDLSTTGDAFSYDGYTIGAGFDDDIEHVSSDIAGSAFPGIEDDDVLLATLSFTATAEGSGTIKTLGTTDQKFYGISYEIDPFTSGWYNINASLDITVHADSGAPVPEPATYLLFGTGFICLLGMKNKTILNYFV